MKRKSHMRQWVESRSGTTQFPVQIISTATIYVQWNNPVTGMQIMIRCPLRGCFWNADSEALRERSGLNTTLNAKLIIPYRESVTGREYIPAEDWYNLSVDDIKSMTIQRQDTIFDLSEDTPDAPEEAAYGDKVRNISDKTIQAGNVAMPPNDFGMITSIEPFEVKNKKYWTVDRTNPPLMMDFVSEHEFEWALQSANNRLTVQISNFMKNPNVFRALAFDPQLYGSLEMQHIILRC